MKNFNIWAFTEKFNFQEASSQKTDTEGGSTKKGARTVCKIKGTLDKKEGLGFLTGGRYLDPHYVPSVSPGKLFSKDIHLATSQTNSPPLPCHENFLKCTFSMSLTHNQANQTEPYNNGIKVQVNAKDIKKEGRRCMKFSTPEAQCAMQFQI